MRVGLVITSLRQGLLFRCLAHLQLTKDLEGEPIALVCDEWSDKALTLIQTLYPGLTKIMLASPTRLGACGAYNRGVRALLSLSYIDTIAILNDDVLVKDGWLIALSEALSAHPEFGLVVATSVERDGSTGPIGIAGCSLHTRESIERIGLFDEAFWGYGGDYDYHLRALNAGYLPVQVANAKIEHHAGSTLGALGHQEGHVKEVLGRLWDKHGATVDAGTMILPPPKFPLYGPNQAWSKLGPEGE